MLLLISLFLYPPASLAQTTIFSDGFEGAFPGSWVVGNNNANTVARWGNSRAGYYSGSWSAFSADNGNDFRTTYDNGLNTYMQRQGVSLSGYNTATLTFKYWMNTEASHDTFQVNVRSQSGTWANLMTISGNQSASGWQTKTLNMDAYAGQTGLIISFDFVSDGNLVPTGAAGVWIDDVSLVASCSGTVRLTVNSSSGGTLSTSEMNAVILFTSVGSEVARKQPPSSNPMDFTNVNCGSYYWDVYCWDMLAARSSIFTHTSTLTSRSVTTNPRRPLNVTVYYSGSTVPFAGATVYLDSYNGQFGTWTARASGSTDSSGKISFSTWPTTLSPAEKYRLRVFNGASQVGSADPVYVSNTSSGSSYSITTSTPVPTGTIRLTVNSSSGSLLSVAEMNAVILFTSTGSEVNRKEPPTANPVDFTGITYGNYYADAYCWDMLAVRSSTISHSSSTTPVTLTTYPRRPLNVTVYYSGGTVPFASATVYLDTYNGQSGAWTARASGTTDSNGNISFSAWPTTLSPAEKYRLRVLNGASQVGSAEPVYVNNTSGGSSYSITASTPIPTGTVRFTVNGSSGGTLTLSEMNAVILFTSTGTEVARKQPPTLNPMDFGGVTYGGYYADVYCWDMLAVRTTTFIHNAATTSISATTYPKRPLNLTVFYSDAATRLIGASVYLDSYNGQFGTWQNRASATTDGSGNVSFSVWPTTLNPAEKYRLRVFTGPIQVWEKSDASVANSSSGSSYNAVTSAATNPAAEFFDDFNYSSYNDSTLLSFGWSARPASEVGGPGPVNAQWRQDRVTFSVDPSDGNNRLMRLAARTQGTPTSCEQSEFRTSPKFLEGTYAARVRITDTTTFGPDVDAVVEAALYSISPYRDNDQNYSECDFEYLPNGAWNGISQPQMWFTTWETTVDRVNNHAAQSFDGWHTLMFQVQNGEVRYYIDGILRTTHGGIYYPESLMALSFQMWFDPAGLNAITTQREYVIDVDWVYHGKNTAYSLADVQYLVSKFRSDGVVRRDTMGAFLPQLGGRLAYHSYSDYLAAPVDSNDGHIFAYSFPGGPLRKLTQSLPVENAMNPHISSDGSRVTFMAIPQGAARNRNSLEIYVYDLASESLFRLTTNTIPDEDSKFSPDGQKIVFKHNGQIWTMNADGSNQAQLTSTANEKSGPNYSPNGTDIAYWSDSGANADIWRMTATGTGATKIVGTAGLQEYYPIYRDTQTILFTRWESAGDAHDKIFSYTTSSSSIQRLTVNQTGANDSDSFPVDTNLIGFSSDRGGIEHGYDIYIGNPTTGIVYPIPAANSVHHDLGGSYSTYSNARKLVVLSPANSAQLIGGSSAVLAARGYSNGGVWSGAVPKVVLQGPVNIEFTGLHDDGINGDQTPSDGIYSKSVVLPAQTGSYTVYASADTTDNGITHEIRSSSLTVTIAAPNNPPTDISLSSSSVAENQPSTTPVGTLSTTDPDAGNTFTYTLVSGTGSTDNASFLIGGNTLRAATSFNYEAKSSYSVRVRSTDQGGLWFEKAFAVTVADLNEQPTDISLSNSTVAENRPSGTLVGTLSTTDPDTGNAFTYTLVTGVGSADNASFAISGTAIQTATPFNYEAKSSYSVRVRSIDQGSLFLEKALTISVTDVGEQPITPTNVVPLNYASNQSPSLTLQASSFLDPDGDGQRASQWIIRRTNDNLVVFDSGLDTSHQTTLIVSTGLLNYGEVYKWQVRYQDISSNWSDYSTQTVFTTVGPTLGALRQGSNMVLFWPASAPGFVLQFSPILTTNLSLWSNVLATATVVGGQYLVTNAMTNSMKFYLLQKP